VLVVWFGALVGDMDFISRVFGKVEKQRQEFSLASAWGTPEGTRPMRPERRGQLKSSNRRGWDGR
jgi:hypothetical protein